MRAVRPYLAGMIFLGLIGMCGLLYSARHLPAQVALRQNQTHWTNQHLQNYRYTLIPNCSCSFSNVLIEVRDGAVKAINRTSDGHPEPISNYRDFAPIEHLFGWIDQRLHSQVLWMTVHYDPAVGYPQQIDMHYRGYGYDDTAAFTISDFQIIK